MTADEWIATAASLLASESGAWLTIRDDIPVPDFLIEACDRLDAGGSPAGKAANDWVRSALREPPTSARIHLHVGDGSVRGYYALASAEVELTRRDRASVAATVRRAPASLVAWIARDINSTTTGRELLLHAAANARRVAKLQGTSVLALDPFDEETANLWITRYGFRECAPPLTGPPPRPLSRLWLPLRTG